MNLRTAKILTCCVPIRSWRRRLRHRLSSHGFIMHNRVIPLPKPKIEACVRRRVPYGRRKVAIFTNQLLDWVTFEKRYGGGERHVLNFAILLRKLGLEVHFYQIASKKMKREYYGFPVFTILAKKFYGEFAYQACKNFYKITKDDYDHIYYNLPEYSAGVMRADAIMTCHGIWFDHDNYPGAVFRHDKWFEYLGQVFSSPHRIVSVDTNSINVIRSFFPTLTSNMTYIPNFVDINIFKPNNIKRVEGKLRILFPRRSQVNRGSRILGDILKLIPYNNVDIFWIGGGDSGCTELIKELAKKDLRLTFDSAPFDEMLNWYQSCDIVVIPTIACEGTSLSCIEALACGCAVVSTNVGGLPNLIINDYNGILCDPNARSISAAINKLIEDGELRTRLQKNAFESAKYFSLKNWQKIWTKLLIEEDWICPSQAVTANVLTESEASSFDLRRKKNVILTRNAICGGVESIIKVEAELLDADVIVCGGLDYKELAPFEYVRADNREDLLKQLVNYSLIIYHWIPDYAVKAVAETKIPSIEFVHRTDTNDCDKSVPSAVVTHSKFLGEYIFSTSGVRCDIIDHPIDTDIFVPAESLGKYIGGITSYYDVKGIDVFIRAWAKIKDEFPSIKARFYGKGLDLEKFQKLSKKLNADIEFLSATTMPEIKLRDFCLVVCPSRCEGLPVVILEALAMNIPVIASNLDGMMEFKKTAQFQGYDDIITLTKQEDPLILAGAMKRQLKGNYRQNTRDFIKKFYSKENHIMGLKKVIDKIIMAKRDI